MLTLPTGELVKYRLSDRNGIWFVRFKDACGRYVRATAGCTNKTDAYGEAAKVILKSWCPSSTRAAPWTDVEKELAATWTGRPRTLGDYFTIIRNLRAVIETHGPHDVTQEQAHRFARLYATVGYRKGLRSDARERP